MGIEGVRVRACRCRRPGHSQRWKCSPGARFSAWVSPSKAAARPCERIPWGSRSDGLGGTAGGCIQLTNEDWVRTLGAGWGSGRLRPAGFVQAAVAYEQLSRIRFGGLRATQNRRGI